MAAPGKASTGSSPGDGRDMRTFFMVQFWNATSFDAVDGSGRALSGRSDLFLRRARIGVRGNFRPDIRYTFNFAYDNAGKAVPGAASGTPQASDNREFYVWDAFATVRLHPQWAHLTIGYFRPQVGRESITTAFKVDSFPKGLTNSYPREHIVGRGMGRETGINLGGLGRAGAVQVNYNLGVFDPDHEKIAGPEDGRTRWAPMWAGRVAVTRGDPEMQRYGIGYGENRFGERRGITVAVNGTYQGQTDETYDPGETPEDPATYRGGFERNVLWGVDLLANTGNFNLSAEYDRLHRRLHPPAQAAKIGGPACVEYTDTVWHVRVGYNIALPESRFLEPVVMFTRFQGDRHSIRYPAGIHEGLDVGLNWFLDRNRLKISLHYIWQDGRPVSRFSTGKDELGDFLGLGMQLVY
jgi:hypothetical protein